MIELPTCRWRGDPLPGDRYQCRIPPDKLAVSPEGVRAETCARCFYADQPIDAKPVVRPAYVPPEKRLATCIHRGRVRRQDGEPVYRQVLV